MSECCQALEPQTAHLQGLLQSVRLGITASGLFETEKASDLYEQNKGHNLGGN